MVVVPPLAFGSGTASSPVAKAALRSEVWQR